MIQRVQSIYLFLASLILLAIFFFPIAHGVYVDGTLKTIKIDGVYQNINGQLLRTISFLALTIVTIVLALVPLIIIWLYKNRKQQIALCYSFILALIGYSFWMSQTVKQVAPGVVLRTDNYGYGMILTSVSIVFVLLAIRGMRNDEKLIKSAERLR